MSVKTGWDRSGSQLRKPRCSCRIQRLARETDRQAARHPTPYGRRLNTAEGGDGGQGKLAVVNLAQQFALRLDRVGEVLAHELAQPLEVLAHLDSVQGVRVGKARVELRPAGTQTVLENGGQRGVAKRGAG
jgi:hypothetical protein